MNDKKIRNIVFLEVLLVAMTIVPIPALITTFQEIFSMSISQSSLIPVVTTIFGTIANLFTSFYMPKIGLRRMNYIFFFIALVGTGLMAFTQNIIFFFIAIAFIGATVAIGLTSSSSIFAHIDKKYQNYGLYHSFFGLGAIFSPAIVGFFISKNIPYQYVFRILFGMYLLLFLIIKTQKMIRNKKYETIRIPEAIRILKKRHVYLILLILTIYAGSEQGIVMWSGNLFKDFFKYSKGQASFFLSLFWVAFTLGRIISDFLEKRIGRLKTVLLFNFSTIISIPLLLFSANPLFFMLVGLGLAPIFPILQKYTAQKLPHREVGLFNGLVFTATGVGNILVAGSMGLVADYSLLLSFFIPVMVCFLITGLIFHLHFANAKK